MVGDATSVDILELTVEVVAAYISNNPMPAAELPALIADVHSSLTRAMDTRSEPLAEAPKPAIAVRKSVTNDFIVCLEDGKRFKSLKRHLRTQYDMSPAEYRQKWGLGIDYPMVAPAYAKARSLLAKEMGLGQQRRRR